MMNRTTPSSATYYNQGIALKAQGKLEEAIESYQKALALKPDFVEAHINMGSVLQILGQTDEAIESYRKALSLRPNFAIGHNNLGSALKDQGKFDEAGASFRRALELKPDFIEAYANLGNTLNELGQMVEAEASFRQALELKPDFAEAHVNLGITLNGLNRLGEAEASFRRAIQLKPDSIESYINLGSTLNELDRLPEAEACYRHALELNADYAKVLPSLVVLFQHQNRHLEALESIKNIMRQIAAQNPQASTGPKATTPITALLSFGRSGSMFFHSLFDGHPELTTLPGVYFNGWFDLDVWKRFAPNLANPDWRKRLVEQIIAEFQPLFDARSRKNVVGKPFGQAEWLSRDSGFMDMGADRSQPFVVDQNAFATDILSRLAPLSSIDQKTCFELIHWAFEAATREKTAVGNREGSQIFYHIHNPAFFEFANFLHHYPQARFLYIVRHPVQGMESWMLNSVEREAGALAPLNDSDTNGRPGVDTLFICWSKTLVEKVADMFDQIQSPFNTMTHSRGVRLEDVKRDPHRVMPQIAAWMGIADDPALYEASFCGLQYWGPASKATGKIAGFDTRAIDQPVGRLLGKRDVKIFETLFWPFSRLYGYTEMDETAFRAQLAEIRPWLDEPMQFEERLYARLPEPRPALEELLLYRRLHRLLRNYWVILDREGTYTGMVEPLELRP